MQIILQQATLAEGKVRMIQSIASWQSGGQGFCIDANAATFASQAEHTLANYQGGGKNQDSPKRGIGCKGPTCFGCEGSHRWCDANGVITCPNKDKPGVQGHAATTCLEFNKKRRAMNKAQRLFEKEYNNKDSPSKKSVSFDSFSGDERRKIMREALAAHAEDKG